MQQQNDNLKSIVAALVSRQAVLEALLISKGIIQSEEMNSLTKQVSILSSELMEITLNMLKENADQIQ